MADALDDQSWMLGAVHSVTLGDARMRIEMDVEGVTSKFGIECDHIDHSNFEYDVPYTLKLRGVEVRFAMEAPSIKPDEVLNANVARAYAWLEQIKASTTIVEIAKADGTSKRRAQQTLDFALLAPDITRDILAGTQPIGLTSTWITTHRLPNSWDDQRALIATLQAPSKLVRRDWPTETGGRTPRCSSPFRRLRLTGQQASL